MSQTIFSIRKATETDLPYVKKLQEVNHFSTICDTTEQKKEGFVSIETTLDLLGRINSNIGIVVAELDAKIIGYELPLSLEHCAEIPLLDPFIKRILNLNYRGQQLQNLDIVAAGQILVDRPYKGQGIAEAMNNLLVKILRPNYNLLVTEISTKNPRSLHVSTTKLGFEVIDTYSAEGHSWYIVAQPLKNIFE